MLQIRLRRDSPAEVRGGLRDSPAETVTVACPDHLVLADLPVAKGIGYVTPTTVIKPIGRRSRRHLGERVHFCVRCDFPIAIYGRLSPCDHAFCLECARSDSICYLCDERIHKIQTIKMMEGIFICAAPHCLRSFLKKADFESHIQESHGELLQINTEKEGGDDDTDVQSTKQSSASDPTLRGPVRPHQQLWEQRPYRPAETARRPGFETVRPMQPPHLPMPMNQNPALTQPFGFHPFPIPTDGAQQMYGTHYEMPRQEAGSDQVSLLGYPPMAPMGPTQTWNPGMPSVPFDAATGGQGGRNSMEGKGILQPPLPPSPHVGQQHNHGQGYQGDAGRDGRMGWQHESRDGFGSGQE